MHQKRERLIIGLVLALIIIMLIVFMFRGCSQLLLRQIYKDVGGRNWRVVLVNGFEIHQINGKDIILVKDNWSSNSNIVISNYINAYCYNERYIGIWCAKDGPSDLLGVAPDNDTFYIVDSQNEILIDQYTKKEYESYCIEQHILGLNEWVYTSPTPDVASFD